MTRSPERLAVLALAVALAGVAPVAADLLNRVVLRVNSEIATQADFEERRNLRIEQIAAAELPIEERRRLVAEVGRTTMKEIFDELLILSRARQLHIEATPAQLERAVDSTKRRMGLESDEQFERALAENGLTVEAFRARTARQLLFNEVLEREVQGKIGIEDEDVARYLREHAAEFVRPEQRRVEEVVVRSDAGLSPDERRSLADSIAVGAAGAPLAEAAGSAASEALSAPIDHGWIGRGTLAAPLEEVVWALPVGGVGVAVDTRGAVHVLKVLEIRPAEPKPLGEVEDEIRGRLGQERFERRTREFLEEQARAAYVVEEIPPEAVGYRAVATGAKDPLRDLLRSAESEPAEPSTPQSVPPGGGER